MPNRLHSVAAPWQETNALAGQAANEVAAKVNAVLMFDAKRLCGEYVAAVETYLALGDCLSGLQLFGRQKGDQRLDELIGETLARTDRRRLSIGTIA